MKLQQTPICSCRGGACPTMSLMVWTIDAVSCAGMKMRRDAVTVTVLLDLHELVFGPGFRGCSRYRGDLIPVFR
jgi:hypothetical protein